MHVYCLDICISFVKVLDVHRFIAISFAEMTKPVVCFFPITDVRIISINSDQFSRRNRLQVLFSLEMTLYNVVHRTTVLLGTGISWSVKGKKHTTDFIRYLCNINANE